MCVSVGGVEWSIQCSQYWSVPQGYSYTLCSVCVCVGGRGEELKRSTGVLLHTHQCWENWRVPLGSFYTPINVGGIEGFHWCPLTHPSMLGELKGYIGVLLHTYQCWGNWRVPLGLSYTPISVWGIEGFHRGSLTHVLNRSWSQAWLLQMKFETSLLWNFGNGCIYEWFTWFVIP